MTAPVLAINVGSSSVRVTRFSGDARAEWRMRAPAELAKVEQAPAIVAHRLVHGGPRLRAPIELDDASLAELRSLVGWAPLHLPGELTWIEEARRRWPAARQVGVFDTALYRALPAAAATYALPRGVREGFDVVRFGFHGLAHASMLRTLAALGVPHARAVTLQLGGGASMTAHRDGRAVDTTMGFSPLEGLVMASRSGDVDPGAILYLLRRGITVETLDRMLEHESGLRGLAGDGDMRALLARDDAEARLAIDVYVHRARKYVGAMMAVLGGCDAIAFGGGVGDNAPAIRAAMLAGFEWAGVVVDGEANARGSGRISAAGSRVTVVVAPVDEAAVLRDEALALLAPPR